MSVISGAAVKRQRRLLMMSQYGLKTLLGEPLKAEYYEGKVLLVANVASM